ncbi:cation:proton antiporter domain-containing protein [Lyngbya confervoides]|uniref:Cation:proton antiporter n=1 Tax=Lyngbya confervoides BDU141951 TaxID=1574623 RepID=A0ABD4T968_9CYAN|nr:cation:proton antiporter [Lyngbya confervoides]MCM1984875.1 cation:proton antiporter [Lyngbya confervoides BDU141951]
METLLRLIPYSPLVAFTLVLLVILAVPPLFEKLRLPGLVGLLAAGIVLGPDGLNLLNAESETMKLLSDIGKVYLMFVAGLEIDLQEFRKTQNRSLSFGVATFLIPMLVGTLVGQGFGFSLNSSILIGSLLASHTLLGFPIVTRLGIVRNEAVTVTVGATIFTDIAALLVLAVCIAVQSGEFSPLRLLGQLVALAIYAALVLVGFDWAGKEYFRRTGTDESNQFVFVLLAVFLASVGAQVIEIDKIIGAFLAGLAVNDVLKHSPVEEKVVFVGSTLFIPFFFVDMGLLIRLADFSNTLTREFLLTLAIVGGLIGSKFLAAFAVRWIYRYSWREMMVMWSLSLPQVAATLAATVVGVEAGLLSNAVFNVVIVMMLVTSILGPVLTSRYGRSLARAAEAQPIQTPNVPETPLLMGTRSEATVPFRVVVPICNPRTERYLIEMAALIARHHGGQVIPLSITRVNSKTSPALLTHSVQVSQQLLDKAIALSQEFQAIAQAVLRIDDDVALGICHAAREQQASLILMGWGQQNRFQMRLFGSLAERVFWSAYSPVAMMRLLREPRQMRHILVPLKGITPQALDLIQFAQGLAQVNQGQVTLLHIVEPTTPESMWQDFHTHLLAITEPIGLQPQVQVLCSPDPARCICEAAETTDLVILRSQRRRTAGGLAVSDVATQVVANLKGSLILFGET